LVPHHIDYDHDYDNYNYNYNDLCSPFDQGNHVSPG